jgi:hypothetical protein
MSISEVNRVKYVAILHKIEFHHLSNLQTNNYSQRIGHEVEKRLTPLIFSPFGIKYQKERRREEKSLLINVSLLNASSSGNMGVRSEVR